MVCRTLLCFLSAIFCHYTLAMHDSFTAQDRLTPVDSSIGESTALTSYPADLNNHYGSCQGNYIRHRGAYLYGFWANHPGLFDSLQPCIRHKKTIISVCIFTVLIPLLLTGIGYLIYADQKELDQREKNNRNQTMPARQSTPVFNRSLSYPPENRRVISRVITVSPGAGPEYWVVDYDASLTPFLRTVHLLCGGVDSVTRPYCVDAIARDMAVHHGQLEKLELSLAGNWEADPLFMQVLPAYWSRWFMEGVEEQELPLCLSHKDIRQCNHETGAVPR